MHHILWYHYAKQTIIITLIVLHCFLLQIWHLHLLSHSHQKHAFFQEMIQSLYGGFKWSFNKLSSSKNTYTRIDLTLQIPSECKLGKDYFVINTAQIE